MMMNDTSNTKRAVFMMGGPASGKSYVRNQRFASMRVLDCDMFKESHPDYDPKNPSALHVWSAEKLVKAFHESLSRDEDFVYDGTGSTAEKYVSYIQSARQAGFHVTVCYVRTSLAVALKRNQNRERVVPEEIVREKHALIATSFEIVSGYSDHVEIVNN